jgi:hypothetical protein
MDAIEYVVLSFSCMGICSRPAKAELSGGPLDAACDAFDYTGEVRQQREVVMP